MANTVVKKRKIDNKRGKMDLTFFAIVLILLTVGLVMLFSASYAYSLEYYETSYKFIIQQGKYALLGLGIMIVVSFIPYNFLKRFAWLAYITTMIMLVILLIFPPMVEGMDVKRWIAIGSFSFQPSEIAKFSIILLFAALISSNYKQMKEFKFILFLCAILAFTCGLIVFEPHLSATVLVFAIGVVLLIVGGLPFIYILSGIGIVGVGGLIFVISGAISYVADRLNYWIDPWSDPQGKGFQTIQSLLAIGSGGILGRGIGQSRQKYLYLPEPHNDFIFSIVCEELGLIGALLIITLFCLLVWRGFKIAMSAKDKFGSLLALGLTFQVGLQAMLNIFVVTNTFPNTGISLPFFSYGGTSLVILLAEMGIVLSVSRESNLEKT